MKQENKVRPSLDVINNSKKYWVELLGREYERVFLNVIEESNIYSKQNQKITLSKNLSDRLNKISKKDDLMLYIILLSVFQIAINKHIGGAKFLLGMPQYLKSDEMINNNELIIIPTNISYQNTFKEFLIQNKKEIFNIYKNQTYPLLELVQRMNVYDKINIYFIMKNIHSEKQVKDILKQKNNILTFILERNENDINILFNYFDKTIDSEVNMIINLFINTLKEVLRDLEIRIKDIGAVNEEEKEKLLYNFNNTRVKYQDDKTIHYLFEKQSKNRLDNIAVICEDKKITYRELNERSNALARTLRKKGVRRDEIVG
ncbi:AMP-binding enzyme, partial [Clostridium cavendishii DSM 21758]